MEQSLTKTAFKRFRSNMSSYIAVGIMCGLFLILVSALSIINETVFFIAIPLLALPALFASHIACYLLEAEQNITMGAFGRYFISFFRPQFRGSFRGIIAFLISLAVSVTLGIISALVMFAVFKGHYGDAFTGPFNSLLEKYLSGMTYDELMAALKDNNGILLTFISFVTAFPLPFAITTFIVIVSYNSISLYYRANIASGAPSLIRLSINSAYQSNRKAIIKDWLTLNWPLIFLPLVGSLVAAIICIFGTKTYSLLPSSVTVGVFIPLVLFLPFYFSNMEVLYHRYENSFKEGNKKAIQIILERIQNSIELTEEEKRNLEESFKNDDEGKE